MSSVRAMGDSHLHQCQTEHQVPVPVMIQGRWTLALIEQLTTIDKARRPKPENYLGHLPPEDTEEIDNMMRILDGLHPHFGLRF